MSASDLRPGGVAIRAVAAAALFLRPSQPAQRDWAKWPSVNKPGREQESPDSNDTSKTDDRKTDALRRE